MQTPLLIAVLTGLGGMIGWGFADLFAKKTIDEIGDITTLVVAHFFGTAFVILVALYEVFGKHHSLVFPTGAWSWLGLAFFGALQGVVYLLVYIGFGKGQVTVLNPIFSSFSGFVALISILFLGEQVRGIVAIGLLVIFGGIMLMNVDWGALRERKMRFLGVPGFPEVAVATVLAAIWTLGWNSFVGGIDWLAYAVAMYVFMTVALLLYALVRGVSLRVPVRGAWKYLVLIGIFESAAYILISWGYSVTTFTSVVAVLSGAFSLPTIIGARVWLKEHTVPAQLWGSLLIVLGVILIALI
ncbi:MAG: hypothetical protein JWN49_304 [Parcubacteria group bacterium]|nr:hypothetical protein [Parcubacteria group bacterium]